MRAAAASSSSSGVTSRRFRRRDGLGGGEADQVIGHGRTPGSRHCSADGGRAQSPGPAGRQAGRPDLRLRCPASPPSCADRAAQFGRNTPFPVVCWSNSLYASSAWSSFQLWVNSLSTLMPRSTMYCAHSSWPTEEKVQEPMTSPAGAACRADLDRHLAALADEAAGAPDFSARIAWIRACGEEEVSSVRSAPSPCVSSRIASTDRRSTG